jgi:hypothetical protein
MAFEYLMAHYLLNWELDKFIENLPRLDDFGYKEIPRHYQEAIVLYTSQTGKYIDLGGRQIDQETIDQYNELIRIGKLLDDKDAARKVLAPVFGRTYFYYYVFGISGIWQWQ